MTLDQVQARIEKISARLRKAPAPKLPPCPNWRNTSIAREARLRNRRQLLESERDTWERLVCEHKGKIVKVAAVMGVDPYSARTALWDLGLWPLVVRERGRR